MTLSTATTSTTPTVGPTGAAPPPAAAPGDQVLESIFTDEQGGDQPLPAAQAVGDANKQIVVAVYGLHVPAITAAQEQELSGNGGPDLRPASVAYQALLQRRPHLGAAKGITPQRFQQVIDKDRAYDTLGATTAAVQQATTGATARAEAQVTSDVATVAAYVGPRTNPANFTDNENITEHFAPVQVQLQRVQTQAKNRQQRQAQKAQSITASLTGNVAQQTALPNLGRLTAAANDKVDLLADPATPPPAAKLTGGHQETHKTAGKPGKKATGGTSKTKTKTKKPGQKATAAGATKARKPPKAVSTSKR